MSDITRDPRELCRDFRKGVTGQADIDVAAVVHEIIQDVLQAVDLAGAAQYGPRSPEASAVANSVGVALDYVTEHYGDL